MSRRVLQLGVAKLIAPFGPGAVVDILGESFVTMTAGPFSCLPAWLALGSTGGLTICSTKPCARRFAVASG